MEIGVFMDLQDLEMSFPRDPMYANAPVVSRGFMAYPPCFQGNYQSPRSTLNLFNPPNLIQLGQHLISCRCKQ